MFWSTVLLFKQSVKIIRFYVPDRKVFTCIMVGIFVLLIKLSQLNIDSQKLTNLLLCRFRSSKEYYCRTCGSKNLHKYRKYHRWILEWKNGKMIQTRLETERFYCDTCHHTHAFLVSLVIPYSSYSLLTVLIILRDYYSHYLTVEKICEKYGIKAPTLYRWIRLFKRDKQLWLGLLRDAETTEIQFLKELLDDSDFGSFDRKFRQMMPDHRSFLQSHKNAQNQRLP